MVIRTAAKGWDQTQGDIHRRANVCAVSTVAAGASGARSSMDGRTIRRDHPLIAPELGGATRSEPKPRKALSTPRAQQGPYFVDNREPRRRIGAGVGTTMIDGWVR